MNTSQMELNKSVSYVIFELWPRISDFLMEISYSRAFHVIIVQNSTLVSHFALA